MIRPRIDLQGGTHTAELAYRETGGDIGGAVVVACETKAEAEATAEVIGRTILAAYDKWEASASLNEGALVLHFDATEILREVRASCAKCERQA